MPTYDYKCNACGHAFELFQQMSDSLKRKCPKCGKPKLERLIGIGAGVLFKGGGFYETDYRSDSYTKAAEAEKKSAETKPAEAKPAETKAADSKPGESAAHSSGESPSAKASVQAAGGAPDRSKPSRVARTTATKSASSAKSKKRARRS